MKRTKTLFILIIILPTILGLSFAVDNSISTVRQFDGAPLRESADANTPVIAIIPFGTKVTILETIKKENIINEKRVEELWVKISANKLMGWILEVHIGTITEQDIFFNKIYEIEKKEYSYNEHFGFIGNKIDIEDVFEKYYLVTYTINTPDAQNSTEFIHAVWLYEGKKYTEVYKRQDWGFVDLIIRNVNKDKYPDLILWEGGCCSTPVYISILLGQKNGYFSSVSINTPEQSLYNESEDFELNDEDIAFDSTIQRYVVSGSYKHKITHEEIKYFYYFDPEKSKFVKMKK